MDDFSSQIRRTAIYIRVSIQEQKVDGYGLESQKNKLREYIKNNTALNLKEVAIFEDTHTGSDLNRKGFKKMMNEVREKKFDTILVWKIDRLSRSLKHLLSTFEILKDNGVSFTSVQENIDFKGAIGGLIFQIFGAIAEFERELIKGRTSMGKITSAEMGNYTGSNIPYGYKPIKNPSGRGKKLEIISEEKKWIEKIFHWYVYEGLGDMAISNKLNDLKVPKGQYSKGRSKKEWTARHIEKIIPNNIYRGEYIANRKNEYGVLLPQNKWTIVKIPECVSEFLFNQAQLKRSTRTNGAGEKSAKYLLSGKIKDMTQNPPLSFSGKNRTDGKMSYYRKQNPQKGLSVFEIPAEKIEDFVWSKILEAMINPEQFIEEWLKREHINETQAESLNKDINRLREEKVNIELRIARIENFGESGTYSEERTAEKIIEQEELLNKTNLDIDKIKTKMDFISNIQLETEKLKNTSEQFKHHLTNPTREQMKTIIQLFVDRVEMYREPLPESQQTGKRIKWKKRVNVVFRFNPNSIPHLLTQDRTTKDSNNNKKTPPNYESVVSGGAK